MNSILRINNSCRLFGHNYSQFKYNIIRQQILLDSRILADLSISEFKTFKAIICAYESNISTSRKKEV